MIPIGNICYKPLTGDPNCYQVVSSILSSNNQLVPSANKVVSSILSSNNQLVPSSIDFITFGKNYRLMYHVTNFCFVFNCDFFCFLRILQISSF